MRTLNQPGCQWYATDCCELIGVHTSSYVKGTNAVFVVIYQQIIALRFCPAPDLKPTPEDLHRSMPRYGKITPDVEDEGLYELIEVEGADNAGWRS